MADINAQAGQVLGVAQPPVDNNQPKDFSNIKLLANQLDQLNKKQEALVSGLGSLNQGLAAEQGAIAQGKQQQAEREAQGQTQALDQQYRQQQAAQQEYKQLLEQNPLPAFVPTKDSGMDLAKLMSSMAVMGTLMGRNGGGQSAINAMASMKGMMEGWQQGRQDLYKKESDEFTKNYNRMLKIHGEFRQEMEDAIKLASTDKERAIAQAHEAAVKLHSPIVMHQVNEGNFKAAIESVKAMDKLVADMKKTVEKQLADALKRENDLERDRIKAEAIAGRYQRRDYYVTPTGDFWDPATQGPPPPGSTKPAAAAKPSVGKAGGDRFGFGAIIATNVNEATASIENIVTLPFDVTTGTFQGRNPSGVLYAPLGALTNKLTADEAQRYNVEIGNFGKSVARVISGGRVVPASVQKDYEDKYKVRDGDSRLTVMTKIANMRQDLERAIEVRIASSDTDPGLKPIYEESLRKIEEAIPFTVKDVNLMATQKDKKKTFTQAFREIQDGKTSDPQTPDSKPQEFKSSADAEKAAREGKIKPGDRIVINGVSGKWE
jgi:hypothetical protein